MCLYPRLINNPKYRENKKNGGNIPQVKDERVRLVPVGCGNCKECRKQKARGWQIRLLEDIKTNKNGKFITLTFSNQSVRELASEIKGLSGYELDNAIATLGIRRFMERWRKHTGKSLRHWLVTEIGHNGTENIHLHGIVWTNNSWMEIEQIWKYGWIWPRETEDRKKNYVNAKTVNYAIKYVHKVDEKHTTYKSKVLTSPGIGNNYTHTHNATLNKWKGEKTQETYRTDTGHKISMPVYWRNKIYSEEEREQLWLQRLDKEERWVMGERVDVSQGQTEYEELVKYYREINKRLGYGNDEKDMEKQQYERARRMIMQKTRIAKSWGMKTIYTKEQIERDTWEKIDMAIASQRAIRCNLSNERIYATIPIAEDGEAIDVEKSPTASQGRDVARRDRQDLDFKNYAKLITKFNE